jgi:hypothetical protein
VNWPSAAPFSTLWTVKHNCNKPVIDCGAPSFKAVLTCSAEHFTPEVSRVY